jgi:hypothetical protein
LHHLFAKLLNYIKEIQYFGHADFRIGEHTLLQRDYSDAFFPFQGVCPKIFPTLLFGLTPWIALSFPLFPQSFRCPCCASSMTNKKRLSRKRESSKTRKRAHTSARPQEQSVDPACGAHKASLETHSQHRTTREFKYAPERAPEK